MGDKPSSKNINSEVAFVGTPSYEVLLEWIAKLQLSINNVKLYNKSDQRLLIAFKSRDCIFVALGNVASKYLDLGGQPHFKLPHPSPRNRKLNNPAYVEAVLKDCKNYLKKS